MNPGVWSPRRPRRLSSQAGSGRDLQCIGVVARQLRGQRHLEIFTLATQPRRHYLEFLKTSGGRDLQANAAMQAQREHNFAGAR